MFRSQILRRLDALLAGQRRIEGKINRALGMALGDAKRDIDMAKSLDRVASEVTEMEDAVTAAEKVLHEVAQQIREAAGDEDKGNALADRLDAAGKRLSEAIVAHTPHQPSGM
jgi:hypothetical protein